jgi:hypothetical protein
MIDIEILKRQREKAQNDFDIAIKLRDRQEAKNARRAFEEATAAITARPLLENNVKALLDTDLAFDVDLKNRAS